MRTLEDAEWDALSTGEHQGGIRHFDIACRFHEPCSVLLQLLFAFSQVLVLKFLWQIA